MCKKSYVMRLTQIRNPPEPIQQINEKDLEINFIAQIFSGLVRQKKNNKNVMKWNERKSLS